MPAPRGLIQHWWPGRHSIKSVNPSRPRWLALEFLHCHCQRIHRQGLGTCPLPRSPTPFDPDCAGSSPHSLPGRQSIICITFKSYIYRYFCRQFQRVTLNRLSTSQLTVQSSSHTLSSVSQNAARGEECKYRRPRSRNAAYLFLRYCDWVPLKLVRETML